jgi:tetratricopeptide (TPR) repeat protein
MRFAIVLLIGLATGTFSARADDSADWQSCDGNSSPSSINACTRIILRGESSVSDLAVAYSNRGLSRAKNGNNDIALADIEQAINLNPENATAYNNRAFTYLNTGENDLPSKLPTRHSVSTDSKPRLTTIVVWRTRTKAITTALSPISAWRSASIRNWSSLTKTVATPIA